MFRQKCNDLPPPLSYPTEQSHCPKNPLCSACHFLSPAPGIGPISAFGYTAQGILELAVCVCESGSVVSDSLRPCGLYLPGSSVRGILQAIPNTGASCHSLLQGIFPTQRSNLGLLHCRQILYLLSHQRVSGSHVLIFLNSFLSQQALSSWKPQEVKASGAALLWWKVASTRGGDGGDRESCMPPSFPRCPAPSTPPTPLLLCLRLLPVSRILRNPSWKLHVSSSAAHRRGWSFPDALIPNSWAFRDLVSVS